jgi:sugar (pentulose or hexulose) kinase
METQESKDELVKKVMEGLNLAVKKVIEEAQKNNEPLAVSVGGKVQLVYQ